MERSITQATPGHGGPAEAAEPAADVTDGAEPARDGGARAITYIWGIGLVVLCLVVYIFINPDRGNPYIHFVWQAQAWLDGQISIPTHVQTPPGNSWYQDYQPILDALGNDTNRGNAPLPAPAGPRAAAVRERLAPLHQRGLLATIFAALDVGMAYWMLGYLPIRQRDTRPDRTLPGPRHGALVRRRDRQHLVLGPHRGRRLPAGGARPGTLRGP